MAEIYMDEQGGPSGSVGGGQLCMYPSEDYKKLAYTDEFNQTYYLGTLYEVSYAPQTGFATDTTVDYSVVAVPFLTYGTTVRWRIALSKTAAGVAPPTLDIRLGINGDTSDASIITFTGAAQTAVADSGIIEVVLVFEDIGVAGTVRTSFSLLHNSANGAGLAGTNVIHQTSSTVDTTVPGSLLGLSMNYGASAVITVHQCLRELR